MRVKLNSTNNPQMQQFVGQVGNIEKNTHNGYTFFMENGKAIATSTVDKNAPHLGDIDNPSTRSLYFQTKSGSIYDFENIEYKERTVDGCFRKDNEFLGFNNQDNIQQDEEPDITDEF